MASNVKDVANRAGVSPKTVSNVVHGRPHVAPETRARVQAAMVELGYHPNLTARSLRSGRTGLLTLAIPNLTQPYFAELAHLIFEAAATRDYTVLIEETEGLRAREVGVLTGIPPRLSDATIISPLALDEQDVREAAPTQPLALLGERIVDGVADHVAIDNEAAARDATVHLVNLGRHHIAPIGYQDDPRAGTARLRYRGFAIALHDANLETPEPVPVVGYQWDEGARALDELMRREEVPDALVCFNDELAIGALRRLYELGYSVPRDVAVIGIDDIAEASLVTPSLSSVAPDKRLLARSVVDAVLARVDNASDEPPRDIVVPHRVVVRESTRGRRQTAQP
jgi:DNA-binding LacI/PurR family transcriptional regulator